MSEVESEQLRKVYVVTSGGKHLNAIRGLFSTRERAEAYVRELNLILARDYDVAEISEWTLDVESDKRVKMGYNAWIRIDTGEHTTSYSLTDLFGPDEPYKIHVSESTVFVTSPISFDHALQIAREMRQGWLRHSNIKSATST